MPATSRILIVGCGVAGPVLAMYLLQSSADPTQAPHITIVERSSRASAYGQNVDIRGAGATIMRHLGLETEVRSSTTGEEGVRFVDGNDRVVGESAADKSGKVQTGTSDIEIMRGRLAEILHGRCVAASDEHKRKGGKGVEFVFGESLGELQQEDDVVKVRFAKSGESRGFDLLVAADGLLSKTRELAFGAEVSEQAIKRLGAYGAFFSMPSGETDSEWRRWYHAPGRRSIMVRPSHRKDRTTVFMNVINEQDPRLPEAATLGRNGLDAQKALVAEYFQGAGWETGRILREMQATDDFYYSMIAQVKMDKWSTGRIVLLGDAGYCASPISGMGTTLAMVGAYNLAGALKQHSNDHHAAFAQYEAHMRPVVARAQKLAPGMPRLFHPETAWGVWTLHTLVSVIAASASVARGLFTFAGPPANAVPVDDYGFQPLAEWQEE
nr:uncharacterized protein CFP56_20346 [Quercus suber]